MGKNNPSCELCRLDRIILQERMRWVISNPENVDDGECVRYMNNVHNW